jgi:hypothetical protein
MMTNVAMYLINIHCRPGQDAILKLIFIQQTFEAGSFQEACKSIYETCVEHRCNGHNVMPLCSHDIASYDLRVQLQNKFKLVPFWHKEKEEFDALRRTIVEDCTNRRCDCLSDDDRLNHLPRCKHGGASHDAILEVLGRNRFGLVPYWNQVKPL